MVAVGETVAVLKEGVRLQHLVNHLLLSTGPVNLYSRLYEQTMSQSNDSNSGSDVSVDDVNNEHINKHVIDEEILYTNTTKQLKRYLLLLCIGGYLIHISRQAHKALLVRQQQLQQQHVVVNVSTFHFVELFGKFLSHTSFSQWFFSQPHLARLVSTATPETTPFFQYSSTDQLVSNLLRNHPLIDGNTAKIWASLLKHRESDNELLKTYNL